MVDPNFRRTVVLIGEHDEEGAVGVVLNRPSEVQVADAVPELAPFTGAEGRMFLGGPVRPTDAVVVAEFERLEQVRVGAFGTIGFLVGEDPEALAGILRARVFAGHAGWGPGQLESEIGEDSWILDPARPEDVFTEDPEGLWSRVLRRKGPKYQILSTMPYDPALN